MEIGRKIYYQLSTGNVVLDTGEMQGSVSPTTEDQDWQLYTALQPYQKSAVGCLQLNYGDYTENFATYPYQIDTSKTPPVIVWDTANPIGATLPEVQISKTAQLQDFYNQSMASGFTSNASGSSVTYGYAPNDQTNMVLESEAIDMSVSTFPVPYGDVHGNVVNIQNDTQWKQLCSDASTFKWSQVRKLRTKIGQVQKCITTDQVNSIQWNDTTPPAIPSGLQVVTPSTPVVGQVQLQWTANTEIDLAGYNVYQDNVKINSSVVMTNSDTITGLTSGTSHNFSVAAIDTDGNESAQCTSISVTVA